jgi:regulatory protein
MPQITQIKLQKNKKVANIFIDSHFAAGLDLLSVKKHGLKEGTYISAKQLTNLLEKSASEKLFNYAYRFLSYRPRSEKEIRTYFFGKIKSNKVKYGNEKLVDKVILKLKSKSLINDQKFAEWWVEQRSRFRQKGKFAITNELRVKGIDSKIIGEVLLKIDEKQAASLAVKKKLKSLESKDLRIIRKKMIGFLKRKGFTWETIKNVVDESLTKK